MSRPRLKKRVSGKNKQSSTAGADGASSMLVPFTMAFVAFLAYLYVHREHGEPPDARADLERWFLAQGGWMSPQLSLESSVEYHGHGLVVKKGGAGQAESSGNDPIIKHEDKILEIPTKLLFTMEKSKQIFVSKTASEAIRRLISNPLDQQDVWIAMDLMLQCSKGNSSDLYPYINLLPPDVPRLATFTWNELDYLQDEDLSGFAKAQAQFLQLAWNNGVESVLLKVAPAGGNEMCQTLDAFKHYVSLSASRAMILDDVKYLTPMADMINHADRPLLSSSRQDDADDKKSSASNSNNFQTYHELQGDKLVVRADRHFWAGAAVVEEYGKLDNSLYVTAFGFVPMNNPHHCAMLPLPTDENGIVNRNRIDSADATVCVRRDGSFNHAQEESMLTMAVLSPDACTTKEECQSHPQREALVKAYLQKAAQERLDTMPTTLEQDEASLVELQAWEDGTKGRVQVAILFRMEEKRLLRRLANG